MSTILRGSLYLGGAVKPGMEADWLMRELLGTLEERSIKHGSARAFQAMSDRWHAFALEHPDIAESVGYDCKTGCWSLDEAEAEVLLALHDAHCDRRVYH